MANRYIGNDKGATYVNITEDSSTTSKDVEVVIDLSASMSKSEVLVKLEEIKDYIIKANWPMA